MLVCDYKDMTLEELKHQHARESKVLTNYILDNMDPEVIKEQKKLVDYIQSLINDKER